MREWASRHETALWAVAAGISVTLLLVDELFNSDDPLSLASIFGEFSDVLIQVASTVAVVILVLRMRAQEATNRELRADLAAVRAHGERWRGEMAEHVQALGSAIRRQFDAWRLTAAEQDVGLFLLKGCSHKEIARFRRTSEATIRQQAASIYQKAGLGGRAALAAYFLDDLLTPTSSNGSDLARDGSGPMVPAGIAAASGSPGRG